MRSPVHDPCSTMLPPVRNVRPVSPKCMLRQRIASDRLFCGSPRSLSQPSNCVSSVPPCGLTRAVMKVSGMPTTTQKPPELSAKVEANTGRPSYASTPSWMDTCQLTFPGCQLTWISPLFTTQFPLSSEPRKTLKPNVTFPFIGLSPSEYRGGCPPDVSSCRSALFGGSIRPPPVHFPVTHAGGGPAQKLGLCATEVSGVESWHAVATSAAAARPGVKRSIKFFSIAPPPRRVVSASPTEAASRQDKCQPRIGAESSVVARVARSVSPAPRVGVASALLTPSWRAHRNARATRLIFDVGSVRRGRAPRGAACGPLPAGRFIFHANTSFVTHADPPRSARAERDWNCRCASRR